ncbi:gastrotropin-like [Coregonus clupeaformis]|uniref:Cytosolic fatty-acid binding proteins domain-containing protein n=1 Tax=Coregonus suidteri TaxID=861788 RepID=A0AAN8L0K8_9TELE|nr:gastrotropin-like [Coregonus clupeaformis]
MAFSGKYKLESQENYDEFLEAIGFANAKTDFKVITEVLQEGDDFTWSQMIPNWTWTNKFTIGKECELETMRRSKFTTTVTMEGGKIAIPFPQYHFTAEISGEKLIMLCTTPGEKGVTMKRISKRI